MTHFVQRVRGRPSPGTRDAINLTIAGLDADLLSSNPFGKFTGRGRTRLIRRINRVMRLLPTAALALAHSPFM